MLVEEQKNMLRNSLPPEMFEAEIEPYLKERQETELAGIYRFIIMFALARKNVRLANVASDWMFNEVKEGYLKPELAIDIYGEVMADISADESLARLFAQTAIEA